MKARMSVAGLIGVLGGIWVGSRSVKIYDWRTRGTIPAPLSVVYEAMTSREAVRWWWPDMELVDDSEDDDLQVGSTVSFRVHQAPRSPAAPHRSRSTVSTPTWNRRAASGRP